MHFARTGPDNIRRFTPTLLRSDLTALGRIIRLETNSPAILQQVNKTFDHCGMTPSGQGDFLWRLVVEGDEESPPPLAEISGMSVDGLYLLNIGQGSFFGLHRATRLAIGFVRGELVKDSQGFEQLFLAPLFTATAESLGLTAFSAACVALEGKGLLVLGPTQDYKTLCCFAASKKGLRFHANQVVFLESTAGELRAWGDIRPATLCQESVRVFPEFVSRALSASSGESAFQGLEGLQAHARGAQSVRPACSVILSTDGEGTPMRQLVDRREWEAIVEENCLVMNRQCWGAEHADVVHSLRRLPAYRLPYRGDPFSVAEDFRSILETAP